MARPPCRARRSTSSCMKGSPDWGVVSRPSSQAWIATGSSCRRPSITAAKRWWSSACTPPLPIRPSRWRVCPVRRSSPYSSTSAGMWKKAPESIACEMRTMSCGTTRPAPRFRCPTSLLPIWLSGSPTARPDAFSSVRGAFAQRRCQVGVRPSSIAFPIWPGRKPQPSSTIRTTGVRGPCLFAILEGMQFSHALRALPVVCSLAPALPAPSPDTTGQAAARYRVATDGEWFYQEVTGKRLARLARGAVVTGGDTKGEWIGVTLDGWIFGTSVGVTPRAGFDLAVTRAPEENLRAAPGGTIVAKLAEGFLLTKLGENGPWVHVERAGWVKRAALEPVVVANSRTAGDSDSLQARLTPGRRPGVADTTGPAADPNRAQPARRTVVYRAPDGPPGACPGSPPFGGRPGWGRGAAGSSGTRCSASCRWSPSHERPAARPAAAQARGAAGGEGLPGARLRRVPRVEVCRATRRRRPIPEGGGDAGGHDARRSRAGGHHQGHHGRGGQGGEVLGAVRRGGQGRGRGGGEESGREAGRAREG